MRDDAIPVIVGSIAAALLGWVCGASRVESNIKEEAIRVGVAYYTNDASGKPQFKWKDTKENKQ